MKSVCLLMVMSACSLTMTPAPSPLPARGPIDCTTDGARPGLDLAAGLIAGSLALLLHSFAGPDRESGEESPELAAGGAVVVGGGFLASAIYGRVTIARCERARYEVEARDLAAQRQREARELARAQAWNLTKQAEAAAGAGDCATVAQLDARVKNSDREFHEIVFARNVAIRRCSAAPSP